MKRVHNPKDASFSGYQKFAIALLAIIQFTVVLDFMVLSPLGAILLQELSITTEQFGHVVSAYAFSAGISAFLAAGFADRFDRKRMLLFFYGGFIVGTLFCGLAPNYETLLIARTLTGFFGGVMSSIGFAIVTDLFPLEKRGRVLGFVQMAFSASQIFGLPIGLLLATHFDWHMPFLAIVALSLVVIVLIICFMRPINAHLEQPQMRNPFRKLGKALANRRYLQGFATVTLLSSGGYMLMPFASAFAVGNLKIELDSLPLMYMVAGACTLVTGPIAGRLADSLGRLQVFLIGSTLAMVFILIFTHLGPTPLWLVIALNAFLYIGVSTRMIAAQTLLTAVPAPADRGTCMSVNSSIQQAAGGFAAIIAGLVVAQSPDGTLERYGTLGYIVSGIIIATALLVLNINRVVRQGY
ncbi:MFS transporter [Pelagicoccus sp. SDUM812003]|uniref:MFS transporter n=1 Tax=Pelagicoccus sp. SDUM812003 TaxID=3041267 RepID=UPI00281080FB|nr:MFS transporter [Pelagicoccus sp. SDUM812003]MDQ8204498.1 MFS transporter [Pelagicoccus sp. SDUM812003]